MKTGWFSEFSAMWAGQAFSLEVEKVLHQEKTKFQDLMILQTKTYGRVLILDGVIQCTERDEFSYQEMMSFLPLSAHPCPKSVLIIGGGDGGVAREVAKYPTVERIVQCEIDDRVIDLSKKYLPFMAQGFDSPKLQLHVGDGFEFMGKHESEFDVIITDSSDPIGPAESLFGETYYKLAAAALKPGGILCSQGENQWYHSKLISEMVTFCKNIFPTVSYAYTSIPTYPGGQIGLLLCSKDLTTKFDEPLRTFTDEECEKMNLRYYSSEIHRASFVLPRFAKKEIYSSVTQ